MRSGRNKHFDIADQRNQVVIASGLVEGRLSWPFSALQVAGVEPQRRPQCPISTMRTRFCRAPYCIRIDCIGMRRNGGSVRLERALGGDE
jgi:hypothetical protein